MLVIFIIQFKKKKKRNAKKKSDWNINEETKKIRRSIKRRRTLKKKNQPSVALIHHDLRRWTHEGRWTDDARGQSKGYDSGLREETIYILTSQKGGADLRERCSTARPKLWSSAQR